MRSSSNSASAPKIPAVILPAGVVVYDQNERLVMFNAAAVASTPLLKRPGIIGISYEELARQTAKLSREFGAPLETTAEEWVARFRSKGIRNMRQAVAGYVQLRTAKIRAGQEDDLRRLVSRYEHLAETSLDAQQRAASDVAEMRSRTASIEQILRTVE